MIPVAEALAHVLALACPMGVELVPLAEACGRVMAEPAVARRDQPPFDSSAMDGYALGSRPVAGQAFRLAGESRAGAAFTGRLAPDEAVRISTGAPVPDSAALVVMQENTRREGDTVTVTEVGGSDNIRPLGQDFRAGFTLPPRLLRPADLALLAAMDVAEVPVRRKPVVALIATGDELVMPGDPARGDQIAASNSFALKAMVEQAGGIARMLPIARDDRESLRTVFALAEGADLVVTIGGASVGDHDLVGVVAQELGLARAFYKVAMRPGKPLMAGRIGNAAMIGLPGNPASAVVCAHVFLLPLLRRMLGLPSDQPMRSARLSADLPANGPRAHYMRAKLQDDGIFPFAEQDSALLLRLAEADALIVRPPQDGAKKASDLVDFLPF